MGRAISPKNIVEYHRHKLMSMTYSLTREITETEAVSKDDIGILFQKIVVDIALNASLGNPAIPDVDFSIDILAISSNNKNIIYR